MNHYDTILLGLVLTIAFIIVFMNGKSFADKLQEATAQPVPVVSGQNAYTATTNKRMVGAHVIVGITPDDERMIAARSTDAGVCLNICNKYPSCKGISYKAGMCALFSSVIRFDNATIGNETAVNFVKQ